jgi:dTDP-4-dehydrorhamnose reductase
VDRAEDEPDRAERVNAGAVRDRRIRRAPRRLGAALLDRLRVPGRRRRPYREDAATGPINTYGPEQARGREALAPSGCKHVVLRTAWVYGARGHNFLLTMLKLARNRDRLTVVDDQHGTPTPARLLAQISALASRASATGSARGPCAARHLARNRPRARPLVRLSRARSWRAPWTRACWSGARAWTRSPAATTRPRPRGPRYSVLDCGRLERAFSLRLPDWREGLATVIGELAEARRDV